MDGCIYVDFKFIIILSEVSRDYNAWNSCLWQWGPGLNTVGDSFYSCVDYFSCSCTKGYNIVIHTETEDRPWNKTYSLHL